MEKFYEYIEKALPDHKGDAVLYKFKKQTVDEMTRRANELTARGLKDKDVISDLIIDEQRDVVGTYQAYAREKRKQERQRRSVIGNVIGSVVYLFMITVIFLGISFSTNAWGQTWVIMADGILLLVAYLLTLGVNRISGMKRVFHIFARVLLAVDIMVLTVALFIFMMAIVHVSKSWILIFGGLIAMFLADGLFASLTKQKLAVINWLIYIPSISAMLFIIIGALDIAAWSLAWLVIPAALIIDLLIIIISISSNSKYDEEVIDAWKEN